ncbi:MAG: hypothetical protein WC911_04620 [Thermoleophilia bacterium]
MKARTYVIALILASMAGVGLTALVIALPGDREVDSAAAAQICSPFGIYSPGSLDEVPGGPGQAMIASLGLDSLDEYENFSLGLVGELGATWARADFVYENGMFYDHPGLLGKYRNNGLDVVGCVRPQNPAGLVDLPAFESDLRMLIGRYPWISVWQIGNEGNLGWNSPEDFARFFVSGQRVVREECPDCRVALGGVATLRPGPQESYDFYKGVVASIASSPTNGSRPFDIFDFHFYGYFGREGELVKSVVEYRDLLITHDMGDVAIWMTEAATTTGRPAWPPEAPAQTEEDQASALIMRFVSSLGAGVERVSWSRPYENCTYGGVEDGYFDNSGLVYNGLGQEAKRGIGGGTRKMAFRAYQLLASRLTGCFGVEVLAPGQYRFSFSDGRQPVFIVWGEPGSRLSGEITGPLTITSLDGLTSEADAGDLSPGPVPVFVERR